MELKVINDKGQSSAALSASDELFGREYNEDLVHQLVVAYQANARSGNSKQKDRAEVRHTTKKPFAQKGTGRHQVLCGVVVVRFSRTRASKTTLKKLIVRCIAQALQRFCLSWWLKIAWW